MKTVKFRVIHRLLLQGILNEEGKDGHALSELNKFLKLIDRLAFKEDEVKALNLRVVDKNEKGEALPAPEYRWNAKKMDGKKEVEVDVEKEFELTDEQNDLLKDIFKKKNEKKEFKLDNVAPMLDIAKQIEVSVE